MTRTASAPTAADHNAVLAKAYARVDVLEERLVRVLTPVLEQAGARAASRFHRAATNFLTASAARRADESVADRAGGWRPRMALAAAGGLRGVGRSSAMVCVRPRPDEAEAIADPEGTPAEQLHCTLAALGSVDDQALPAIVEALKAVGADHAPLTGVVGGYGVFRPPGVGILLPDVPGLVELRVAVTEALAAADVSYARNHGFQPHLTVDGDPEPGEQAEMLGRAAGRPLHFDAILVVRGDETVAEIPLVGIRPLTAAGGDSPKWAAPAGDEILDVPSLVSSLRAKTDPVRRALLKATMKGPLDGVGIDFDVTNPLVGNLLAQSGSQIQGIADTTQLNVMKIVGESYDNGLSIPDTAKAIQAGMRDATPARARMIARTELSGVANGGSLAATQVVAAATGATYYKKWLTAPGAKYPRHELLPDLDGQTVALDAAFDVDGSPMQHPGDPSGDPDQTINCRCAMSYTDEAPDDLGGQTVSPPVGAPDDTGALVPDDETTPVAPAPSVGLSQAPPPAPPADDTTSVATAPFVPPTTQTTIQRLGLDQWPPPKSALASEVFGDAADTAGLYKTSGAWTPERERLHDDIVNAHFAGKEPVVAGNPTAYFTAGGGASGKSGALFGVGGVDVPMKQIASRPDTVLVDPDRIKEMLPEYHALRARNDFYAAAGVHEESSEIAKRIVTEAQKRGMSIITDTTGSSDGFLQKLAAAKAAGYDVKVTMVSTPTNEAIVRSVARGDKSGRYVALNPLKKAHAGASRQMALWKDSPNVVGEWRVYDNSGPTPRLVASGQGSKATIADQKTLDQILAKADEQPGTTGAKVTAPGAKPAVPAPLVTEEPSVSVDVGVTPFRANEDNAVGFYDSVKFKRFVSDVNDSAETYGVHVDGVDKVTGIWEGDTEPSVSLKIHDGEKGVRAYAANLGQAYNQDGVLLFSDVPSGEGVMGTFRRPVSHDEAAAAMKKAGIDGGRFTTGGRLQVIGVGPDFVKKLNVLAGEIGRYDSSVGRFDLLERDSGDYRQTLDQFAGPSPATAGALSADQLETLGGDSRRAVEAAPPISRPLPITAPELDALDAYLQAGYRQMNERLRSGVAATTTVQAIDGLMRTSDSDMTLFRAIRGGDAHLRKMLDLKPRESLNTAIGTRFSDAGYVSTSTDFDVVQAFDPDSTPVIIDAPAGTSYLNAKPYTQFKVEDEVLLARGLTYEVVGTVEVPDVRGGTRLAVKVRVVSDR